jgi:hypothetical protein
MGRTGRLRKTLVASLVGAMLLIGPATASADICVKGCEGYVPAPVNAVATVIEFKSDKTPGRSYSLGALESVLLTLVNLFIG